jgi:hypothetical protein
MTDRRLDAYEADVLAAYEAGELEAVAGRDEFERLLAAARATGTKDRRVNSPASSTSS